MMKKLSFCKWKPETGSLFAGSVFFIFTFAFLVLTFNFASALTINDLVSDALKYDGQILTVQGEVVGDIMKRSDNEVWLHLYDGTVALGVFCSQSLLPKISHAGDYKYRGDILQVIGVFNRACTQHGGDLDLHAHKIVVLEPGQKAEKPLDSRKLNAIYFLAPLALMMMFIRRWWK